MLKSYLILNYNWLNNKKELVEYKSAYFEKKRLPSGGSKVNIFWDWPNSVLYDSAETARQGKIWFFSYDLKCSQPIILQYSLIINISGRDRAMPYIFFMEIIIIKEGSIWDYYCTVINIKGNPVWLNGWVIVYELSQCRF